MLCQGAKQTGKGEKRRQAESQNPAEEKDNVGWNEAKSGGKTYRERVGASEVSEMMKDSQKKCDRVRQTKIGKWQMLQIKKNKKNAQAMCVIAVARSSLTCARWPQASSALHLLSVFIWFLCTAVIFLHSRLPPRHPAAFVFPLQQQNGLVLSSNLGSKGQGVLLLNILSRCAFKYI